MAVRIAAVNFLMMALIGFAGNLSVQSGSSSSLATAEKMEKAVRVIDYSFDMLSYTVCMETKSCYKFRHSKNKSLASSLLPVTCCFYC